MKMLFSHIDYSQVGHFESVLEGKGIRTLVKNKEATGSLVGLPSPITWPQLWVVKESDYQTAVQMIEDLNAALRGKTAAWKCPQCQTDVEEGFAECWNCGTAKEIP